MGKTKVFVWWPGQEDSELIECASVEIEDGVVILHEADNERRMQTVLGGFNRVDIVPPKD